MSETTPAIFREMPSIPSGLSALVKYKLDLNAYKTRIKSTTWIFIEIIGTLLILGIIWINVDWVRVVVTVIAVLIVLILLIALTYAM